MVVAASPTALSRMENGVTRAVINSALTPTASFVLNGDIDFEVAGMQRTLRDAIGRDAIGRDAIGRDAIGRDAIGREAGGKDGIDFVDGTGLATALMGDSIATNLFMLGYAVQKGLVPLGLAAIERAIELNGVAVENSKRTFNWGRLAAHDRAAVEAQARPVMREEPKQTQSLAELVARRAAFLTSYQDEAYAERYRMAVARVEKAERDKAKGRTGLAETFAKSLFKLMAYKDEYEVARLYTDGDFLKKLHAQFEGDFKLEFNLAPPLFAKRDPATGELQKRPYGAWTFQAFKLLAKLKGLRGTAFDIFGHSEERKTERRLIGEYEATMASVIAALDAGNHALSVQIAALPEQIRGFGHVKEKNLAQVKAREANLLAAFHRPAGAATAAE
jgi:indolepyruvate ferredoxin oxidoreductase